MGTGVAGGQLDTPQLESGSAQVARHLELLFR
jgi:hypothetical protein